MTVSDLIRSISIDNVLQQRDAMVERVRMAHALLQEAAAIEDAVALYETRAWYRLTLENAHDRLRFTDPDTLPRFQRKIDAAFWDLLMEKSGLRTFMDAEARGKWDRDILKGEVPELTRANVDATFSAMHAVRQDMFERGVVNVFRKLSWEYKTNSPVKLGKRIVERRIVWTCGNKVMGPDPSGCNDFDDLLRVMFVLDGKPEADHREGAYHKLRAANWPREQQVVDLHGLVRVRGFKNGNAHVTFLRPDLVDQMNKIIAKHYPGALPPSEAQ